MAQGWAIDSFATIEEFENAAIETGFQHIKIEMHHKPYFLLQNVYTFFLSLVLFPRNSMDYLVINKQSLPSIMLELHSFNIEH